MNLFGQVSGLIFLKKFSKVLNAVYRDHYTFKLANRRGIAYQNDFFEKHGIKEVLYVFSGVNMGTRDGKTPRICELTTGLELNFAGSACIIKKTLYLENIEAYGGFEPLLVLLTKISRLSVEYSNL